MKQKSKPTIYDIAKKAAASPSTVSSVLNGTWQKRRIGQATAARIKQIAAAEGYAVNLQARGLRKARSGLAGMILPEHENRFFSALSQSFALEARDRGLCPAIVLAGRDPHEQAKSVADLIGYSIDLLVIAGAAEPEAIAELCRDAGLPHVFVDHPCDSAPSVVSDNYRGALDLTRHLIDEMPNGTEQDPASHLYFLGGDLTSFATRQRLAGFRDAVSERNALFGDRQILTCGYDPSSGRAALAGLYASLGQMPSGLFVNSVSCFDGAAQFLRTLPPSALNSRVIGCYDFEPFGDLLSFPVHMVRQRAEEIVAQALRHFDEQMFEPGLTLVPPELKLASHRETLAGQGADTGSHSLVDFDPGRGS